MPTLAPLNLAVRLFERSDDLTGKTTAAVTGKRFGKISGDIDGAGMDGSALAPGAPGLNTSVAGGVMKVAQSTAGDPAVGVFERDAASGALVGLLCDGIVPVTAGGNITAGDKIGSDANGKAVTYASGEVLGWAYCSATSGNDCFVKLKL